MEKKITAADIEAARKAALYKRFIIYVAAFMLLFTSRFIYHPQYLKMSRDQCHTGAIATDILDHGFRLSYFDYLPERNGNGAFIAGLAAIPFFAIVGKSVFALKLIGFIIGALTMLIGLWLIRNISYDGESGAVFPYGRASLFYVFLTAFGPPMFINTSVSALGGPNESALAASLIIALYALRRFKKSALSNAALWAFGGFSIFWAKDSFYPLAVVALFTLAGSLRFKRIDFRNTIIGAAAFAAGLSPAIAVSITRRGGSIAGFFNHFNMFGGATFGFSKTAESFANSFFSGFGYNPVFVVTALIAFGFETAWFISLFIKKKRPGRETFLSTRSLIYVLIAGFAILKFMAVSETPDSYQCWLALWFYLIATTVARAISWLEEQSNPSLRTGGSAGLFLVVIFALNWKAVQPVHGSLELMKSDTVRAACYWRFGRAFVINSENPELAADKCRIFVGIHALDCISGISTWDKKEPANLDPKEAQAYAFGRGARIFEQSEIEKTCSAFSGVPRQNCVAGALANLAINDSLKYGITTLKRAERTLLPCEIRSIPYEGFETMTIRPLVVLPADFMKLCGQNKIQPHCGLYQGMCARVPFDCLGMSTGDRNDCIRIYKMMN
ncbi:MAG: hypothetical protein WCX65_08180 [bacterium]